MSLIKENVVESAQDDVRFRIVIPAGSLSFNDYLKGNRIVFLKGVKRSPTRTRSMIIGATVGIALFIGMLWLVHFSDLKVIAAGWHANANEYLFRFTDLSAMLLFVYLFFFGWISAVLWIRRCSYKFCRIRYRATNSINAGYRLELTASGIRSASLTDDGALAWQSFTGWANVVEVIHGENVDYIVLQPGLFLWVPKALEASLRNEALAFIEQKLADVAKSKGGAS